MSSLGLDRHNATQVLTSRVKVDPALSKPANAALPLGRIQLGNQKGKISENILSRSFLIHISNSRTTAKLKKVLSLVHNPAKLHYVGPYNSEFPQSWNPRGNRGIG